MHRGPCQGCLMAKCRRCVRSWGLNSKIGRTADLFFMSTQDNPFSWNEYRIPAVWSRDACARRFPDIPVIHMVENMCNTSSRPLRPITMHHYECHHGFPRFRQEPTVGSWGSMNLPTVSGPEVAMTLTLQYLLDLDHDHDPAQ
jgi:hypothetical protein